MVGTDPVLTSREDMMMWKRVCDFEKKALRRSDKIRAKFDTFINDICRKDEGIHPLILCRLMTVSELYYTDNLRDVIINLIGKCDLSDCTPQIRAAKMLADMGSYDSARLILDRITAVSDVPQREYLCGIIDLKDGDTDSALVHFLRANAFDNFFMPVYVELEKLDPNGGWGARKKIALICSGEAVSPPGDVLPDSPLDELYQIYYKWYRGDTQTAFDTLTHIDGYDTGDIDVTLADARMKRSTGAYRQAIECYESVISLLDEPFSVSLELIETYLLAEMTDEAAVLCKKMEKICPADRRFAELQIRVMTAKGDRSEVQRYSSIFLYYDYADRDAYGFCAGCMIELSMHTEATRLISAMKDTERDDPKANLLESKNEYKAGRYDTALRSAKNALRHSQDKKDCQMHLSAVYLALKNSKKALKEIDEVLIDYPEDLDALILKKDICKLNDRNEALSLCDTILKIDPRNTAVIKDAADILNDMGRYDDALRKYTEALEIYGDPVLFVNIITSMAEQKRNADAVDIIGKYDDMYGDLSDTWIIKGNCQYALGRYFDAADSYRRATEIDSGNPVVWHSKGLAEEAAGMYEDAEQSFDKAVLMDLDNADYWISKAMVHKKKEEFALAIDSFNRVISLYPDNIFALLNKALLLVRLGKMSEALFFIDLALKISPRDNKVLSVKRDILFHEGEYEKCDELCTDMLRFDPKNIATILVLARIRLIQERYNDAVALLIKADGIKNSDLGILCLLREAYHGNGDLEFEMSTCKRILQIDADNREIKLALVDIYVKKGNPESVKNLLDELSSSMPNDPELSIRQAKMTEDQIAAMAVLMETLERDPGNKSILLEMADLKYLNNEVDDSLNYLDRATAVDPADPEIYLRKSKILVELGEYSAVLTMLNEALHHLKEPDSRIWSVIGDMQSELGSYSDALISYDSAIKLGDGTFDIYLKRGKVQEKLGMSDAALGSFETAHQMEPGNPEPVEHIVGINMERGRFETAKKDIDRAIKSNMVTGLLLYNMAKISEQAKDMQGLKNALDMSETRDIAEEYRYKIRQLVEGLILSESALAEEKTNVEHTDLSDESISFEPVEKTAEDYAYDLLRKSHETGAPLDDPDLLIQAGVPAEMSASVYAYLTDVKEYGDISVDGSDFSRMESLSCKAVLFQKKTDIESDPMITLDAAYFGSGANDLDEAKRLIAYIYKAMTCSIEPECFSDSVNDALEKIVQSSGDVTVYSVMEKYGLGVYSARTVKLLSVRGGPSVVEHI